MMDKNSTKKVKPAISSGTPPRRKQAEEAFQTSEQRYRLLFEKNPLPMWVYDRETLAFLAVNDAAIMDYGYQEDEFLGMTIMDIRPKEEVPRLVAVLTTRSAPREISKDIKHRKKDGTLIDVEIVSHDLDWGGRPARIVLANNITARKQAEKRLIESEAKFRSVFEHSPLGKSLTGVDGTLSVNQAFCDIVGYSEEELRAKKWKEITHPDDIQINLDAMQALLDGKIPRAHFEKRYIHKNGNLVWTDVITVLERDEDGKPLYFLTSISDITERKRAAESLQRSLEQITHGQNTLQALSLAAQAAQRAHTPQAIYQAVGSEIKKLGLEMMIFNFDAQKREMSVGFMTYAKNLVRASEKLTGLSAKTLRIPMVAGGYYDQVLSAGRAILYTDAVEITAEILPAPLRRFSRPLLNLIGTTQGIYAPLVVENQPQGFLIVMGSELGEADLPAVDLLAAQVSIALENARLFQAVQLELVERKRADEALSESEKRFRALIENSSDAITLLDAKGIAIYDSPAAPGMLGYTSEDWIGKNVFALVHPDDLPEIQGLFQKLVKTPGARVSNTFRVGHKNGSWLWIEAVATNLLAEPGVQAIVLNYRDVTNRKQAEATLQKEKNRAQQYLDIAGVMFLVLAADWKVILINKKGCEILGYTEQEIVGRNWLDDFLPPEKKEQTSAALEQIMTGNIKLVEYFENPVLTKSGRERLIAWRNSALTDETGRIIGIVSSGEDITERRQAEERIRQQIARLTALSEIDRAISSSFDLQLSLATLLVHVIHQLGVDATDILLFDTASETLEYAAGLGFHTQAVESVPIQLSKGHAARAILNRRPVYIPDLKKQPDDSLRSALFVEEGFLCYYGVPLLVKGELNGMLEVFQRSPLEPDEEWHGFLKTLAGQAGIAIDNANLFKHLRRSNTELTQAYDATIEGWSRALDLRDKETEGHSQRVMEMTLDLARAFRLSAEELVHVRWGALLHDIGKMGVPDGILLKPGPLNEDEWELMKKHPIFAYDMLSPIAYLQSALDIPYCHHEKWDGTGYPRGLKGEQIPLSARMFAVVDVWDALTSDRTYRKAWPAQQVREHIRSLSGAHFDPQVVKAFLESDLPARHKPR